MARGLDVCFLWHMHQPCYANRATGEAILPWVRLHATKAYFDMAAALAAAPESTRITVNFVPVLMDQLAGYQDGTIKDTFLSLSQKPAEELTPEESRFLLRYFFMANWQNMVRPFERYWSLLVKRGMDGLAVDLDAAAKRFTAAELRDLQVWFNLSWFGWAAREKFPVVDRMIKKGRDFTEDDKKAVLAAQIDCIRAIVPAWRKLADEGKVELTATPFYHPILPLVISTRAAQRAVPDIALPEDFVAPEDAEAHVARAAAFHEKTWGRKPRGMWPAEGSVSPEVVPLFRRSGVEWIASDEDVLFRSLDRRNRDGDLYRPWRAAHDGQEISFFFRDRVLSDLVGFTYSKMGAADAANEFLGRVKSIAASAEGNQACVPVILDGENPWEWYADGGRAFLARLYEGLANGGNVRTSTFARHLDEHWGGAGRLPEPLPKLHSGSWIASNYRIWIGHWEDNAGWNLLRRAREEVRRHIANTQQSAEAIEAATDNLHRAEGSDWFWWFGDDFSSDNDAEFDLLFRTHLMNAYRAVGLEPPQQTFLPIKSRATSGSLPPRAFVSPRIDGEADSYFEWKGAGYYSVGKSEGTMHKGTAWITGIHYGFDLENLYFRIDPVAKHDHLGTSNGKPAREVAIVLSLTCGGKEWRVSFPFRAGVSSYRLHGPKDGKPLELLGELPTIGYAKVLELALPVKELALSAGAQIDLSLRVVADDTEVDRYPRTGMVRFPVPSPDFERVNWWV